MAGTCPGACRLLSWSGDKSGLRHIVHSAGRSTSAVRVNHAAGAPRGRAAVCRSRAYPLTCTREG